MNFAEARGHPGDWTYVRFFHVFAVVDPRNSGLTLANVPVVADPVAQHGHFCISFAFMTACFVSLQSTRTSIVIDKRASMITVDLPESLSSLLSQICPPTGVQLT